MKIKKEQKVKGQQKGQIFSTDLAVASMVFLAILGFSIIYSTETGVRLTLLEENNEREETAIHAANSLIYTEGSPFNWEDLDINEISSIGISDSRNVFDSQKVQKLVDLNSIYYSQTKDLLGLSKYDVQISLLNMQNNQSLAEFGLAPEADKKVTLINRFGVYDGQEVLLQLKVYEE